MNKVILFTLIILPLLLISSGAVNAVERQTEELVEIVKEFLPADAELMKPNEPAPAHSIQAYDFDQDGQNEIVATFRIKDELKKLHVILLKKESQQWKKIWEVSGDGFGIEFSGFEDITGDGVKEYLIAWAIGASAGSKLEVYRWENGSLKNLVESPFYHEMELLKEGGQTSLALWERYCCDAFIVDVLKWDGTQLLLDKELYRQYYPKIQEFYQAKIKEMDAWFYWYALADAQLKANLLDEAKESIQKGFSFSLAKEKFDKLQKRLAEKTAQPT